MEEIDILTCKLGNEIINCYDGTHNKEQFKKWASKKILLCPVCNKPYEYCHGAIKTQYFRHMEKSVCEDLYSESETEEHLNGKRDLFEWIKKQKGVSSAILEGWIPETRQRPDIMFKYNNSQYVIEYQCTPIATEYKERHDLYCAAGIKDIWILGTNNYLCSNMREKFIQKYSVGFYNAKNNYLFFSDSDYISKINMLSKKRFEFESVAHANSAFFGISIFDAVFDGEIFHKYFADIEKSMQTHNLRKPYNSWSSKYVNENRPLKYFEKYKVKVMNDTNYHFLETLKEHKNWSAYIYKRKKQYTFCVELNANPNDDFYFRKSMNYYSSSEQLTFEKMKFMRKSEDKRREVMSAHMNKCIKQLQDVSGDYYRNLEVF